MCVLLLLFLSLATCDPSSSGHLNLTLMATEVFKFSFNPSYFNWSRHAGTTRFTYRYRCKEAAMPPNKFPLFL